MKFLIPCLAIVSIALAGKLDHLVHQSGAYSHQAGVGAGAYGHQSGAYSHSVGAGAGAYGHQSGAYSHQAGVGAYGHQAGAGAYNNQHQAGHGAAVQHEYVHQPAAYAPHHVSHEAGAPIVKSGSDISPDGSYGYEYETGNGISAKEHGVGGKGAQGAFSYTAPDGQVVHLSYVADEHGFHPTGSHIPQPPPTPAHVLRSLEYIAAHPHQEQKYAHVQAGSAHLSTYSSAGHSAAHTYNAGQAQAYNAGQAHAYSAGHGHAQTYNHNAYAHGNALTHQATPYHHYK